MRRALVFLLVSCGGLIDPGPPDETAYYLDDTCAARPAGLSARTVEPGWHFDGSDPKVRAFDTSQPSPARRVCWRAEGPNACPCRLLEPFETAYGVQR